MGFAEFFKPTFKKIALALIIFAVLPVFQHTVPILCMIGVKCDPIVEYVSILATFSMRGIHFSYFTLFGLIIAYIISAIIIYIIKCIPEDTKEKFEQNLKLSKGRVIISALGCVSIIPLILHSLSGKYGGLASMPSSLNSLYGFGELLSVILLPFAMITRLLFYLTGNLISLFMFITKISFNLTNGSGLAPEYLTSSGIVLMVLFIALEWYMISCSILYMYDKLRKKN